MHRPGRRDTLPSMPNPSLKIRPDASHRTIRPPKTGRASIPAGPLAAGLLAACVAIFALPGCGMVTALRGTSGSLVSDEQPNRLDPAIKTRLFDYQNNNTADIVLSDLPPEILADGDAWQSATGQIIHARMFVQPRPGRTPIETTACTVTLRYIVLAGEGQYGIYAGGGFLIPDGAPEGTRFSGEIHNATLRLVSATPGFKDLIGSGTLGLDFRASRDENAVARATRNADFLAFAAIPTPQNPLLAKDAD